MGAFSVVIEQPTEAINEEYHCHRYCTRHVALGRHAGPCGEPRRARAPGSDKSSGVTPNDAKASAQNDSAPTGGLPNTPAPPRIPLGARPKAKLQACRRRLLTGGPSLASGYLTAFLIFNGQFDRGAAECWARHIRRLAPSTRSVPRLCLITGAIPGFREPVRASELLLILISGVRLGVDASRPSGLA